MATTELMAIPRTIVGKAVKKLRRQGLVPAVLYGPGVEGTHAITLVSKDIERVYVQLGRSALLQLRLEGGASRSVLIHQVQYDHTHRRLTHVDFLAPDMRVELTISVPVALTGEAPAVTNEDGVLVQTLTEVQVSALPGALPAALTIDVSVLTEIGSQLSASDVELPAGVTLVTPGDEALVTVSQSVDFEQELAEEEAEAAAVAEAAGEDAEVTEEAEASEEGADAGPQTERDGEA